MSTIKKNFVWIVFLFSVVLFVYTYYPDILNIRNRKNVHYKIVQEDGNWGYDIYKKDSIFIHQMTIPALQGIHRFASESDAQKVAELAVKKMKLSFFPVISIKELDSLAIH